MAYRIIRREALTETVVRMDVEAPLVARKARAGQFVILRADERGERIPLTVADLCGDAVTIVFQIVGGATMSLARKREGEFLADFVGPLGKPTDLAGLKKVAVVGGGVGSAIALPVAKALRMQGAEVTGVIGFRNRGTVLLEKELRAACNRIFFTTDDGSWEERGNVCAPLRRLLESERFDRIFVAGPLVMMKAVAETTRPYAIGTVASMNPIMIDGTGMCGCCRLTVGGKTVFACVDGPDFDAHLVDFDEAILRSRTYLGFERRARERNCHLLKEGDL